MVKPGSWTMDEIRKAFPSGSVWMHTGNLERYVVEGIVTLKTEDGDPLDGIPFVSYVKDGARYARSPSHFRLPEELRPDGLKPVSR